MFSIFAIISAIIDIFLLKKVKRKAPIANVLFGIHITLIGIFIFSIVYNTTFYNRIDSIIPYFIAIYLITTGFIFSLIEFVKQ